MKIVFLLGDDDGPERRLAEETKKMIGKDAEIVWYDPARPFPSPQEADGVWIFTHEEGGGCPESLMTTIENHFSSMEDMPAVATGIGGKEGGMNAVSEIAEYFEKHGGRFFTDSEPLCIPLRTARFELGPEERMDLFFLVDGFLKYCGMDDSESRKIAFDTVINDYFRLMKFLSPAGPRPTRLAIDGDTIETDAGTFDCAPSGEDVPPEIGDLHYEIGTLVSDYEIEPDEIAAALLNKLEKEW